MTNLIPANPLFQMEVFRDKYINDHANAKKLVFAAVEKAWVSYRWIERSLDDMANWFQEATGIPDPAQARWF